MAQYQDDIQFLAKYWLTFLQLLPKLHLESVLSVCLCKPFYKYVLHISKRKRPSMWYQVSRDFQDVSNQCLNSTRTRRTGVPVSPQRAGMLFQLKKHSLWYKKDNVCIPPFKVMLSVLSMGSQGSQLTFNLAAVKCTYACTHPFPLPTLLPYRYHHRCHSLATKCTSLSHDHFKLQLFVFFY